MKYVCSVSGKEIPKERVDFLMENGVPESEWTVVEHSPVKRKKGIYMGEYGTSEMKVVDKVYDDSVRSIFSSGEVEEEE